MLVLLFKTKLSDESNHFERLWRGRAAAAGGVAGT
jgi:hypothetical protein